MILYLDTSALVKLYFREPFSDEILLKWQTAAQIITSSKDLKPSHRQMQPIENRKTNLRLNRTAKKPERRRRLTSEALRLRSLFIDD